MSSGDNKPLSSTPTISIAVQNVCRFRRVPSGKSAIQMVRVMNLSHHRVKVRAELQGITDDVFTLIETSTVLIDEDQYFDFRVRFTPDRVNGHYCHDFVLRVNGFDDTMCCRLYGTGDTVELLKVSLNSTLEKRCNEIHEEYSVYRFEITCPQNSNLYANM